MKFRHNIPFHFVFSTFFSLELDQQKDLFAKYFHSFVDPVPRLNRHCVWCVENINFVNQFQPRKTKNSKREHFNSQMKLTRESSSENQNIRQSAAVLAQKHSSKFIFYFFSFSLLTVYFLQFGNTCGSRLSGLMDKSEIVRCLKSAQIVCCLKFCTSNQKKFSFPSSSSVFIHIMFYMPLFTKYFILENV